MPGMPPPPAGERIEFGKSNNVMRTWSARTGEICSADIRLLLDRAPPPMRGPAAVAKTPAPDKERVEAQPHQDRYANLLYGVIGAVEAAARTKKDFQHWLDAPAPPPSSSSVRDKPPPARKVPPFDLQDIPGAMRKIGAPVGAALMERWFAGALNYAPTSDDEGAGVNQEGMPFPADMFDLTTVKMDWVMQFSRARQGVETLKSLLETPKAKKEIANALFPYRNRQSIWPWLECGSNILRFHEKFQFQKAMVEGSLSQKLNQFAAQSFFNNGLPDDLTCALGSFNLYAGISYALFDGSGGSAVVTHINIYIKDNFTFTDKKDELSQYLGHWSRNHVAIVPSHELARRFNLEWLNYAVVHGSVFDKDAVLYPVRNSDFRDWQRRHCRGGDFIIYSDIMTIQLDQPIKVRF